MIFGVSMSRPYIITDTTERKMDVSIDASGAVSIVKKWIDHKTDTWIVRDLVVNGDEWERIAEAREKEKK